MQTYEAKPELCVGICDGAGGKDAMKNRIDWKQFGQFLKMVIELFKLITSTFKELKVGPEILEWVTGPGQKIFVEQFLIPLGNAFQASLPQASLPKEAPKKQNLLRMKANLDADPSLPFDGAMFDGTKKSKHARQGQVELEYRPDEDELYVNGKKFVPYLSEKQLGDKVVRGYDLQVEAEANSPTNATLADVLYEHQEFIPKKFRDRAWFFWATIFSDSDGDLFVRYLVLSVKVWYRDYDWLDSGWGERSPSASLASEASKL